MKSSFSAVLLAGGLSSRMGIPKATLEFSGQPLWRRQAELLDGLGPDELMISAGTDWSPTEGPWRIVRDLFPGLGPLGGLQSAAGSMTTDWLVVLAVDMPAMSGAYLQKLVDRSGRKGCVPVIDGFYEGLAAVYPKGIGRLVEQAISTGDRSIQSLINRAVSEGLVEQVAVADADRGLFRNVNSPEDL